MRDQFIQWIRARIAEKTANGNIRYLDKYLKNVTIKDKSDIIDLSLTVTKGWNWYAKSMRNYINFLEEKGMISTAQAQEWKQPLKLKRSGTDTWVPSTEAIKEACKTCENGTKRTVFLILLYSGVRGTEAQKMLENFDKKRLHIVDEVAYYDLDWKRGSKNSNKVFLPADFAKTLRHTDVNLSSVQRYFSRIEMPIKYCRNFFIDQCVRAGIHESLIKYMIGHSGGSVLMTNYLEKLNNSTAAYKKVMPVIQEIVNDV